MEKPTKRKAFNFLRSYFDVVNELDNDSDKLSFLMAIIDKQFLDKDPKSLNFIVNLCYSSQKHAVESSVKGWKRVAKTDMIGNPMTDTDTNPPTNPRTNPQTNPQEEEVKEEEKEEEKEKVELEKNDLIFNELTVSQIWLEKTAMHSNAKFSVNEVKVQLKKYNDMINLQFDKKTNKTEYCTHFINWLNKQQKQSGPTNKRIIS